MLKIVLLATVALVAATPAMAQDLVVADTAVADFAGPRAEVRLGLERTTLRVAYDDGDTAFAGKGRDNGFSVGAEVGYDVALGGKGVVGAYAGVSGATTKDCGEVFGNDESCLKLGRNLTVGARIGAAVTPQALIYVKGGYSNGQLRTTYKDFEDSDFNTSESSNRGGAHLGLGGEFNLTRTGYLKLEAVQTNYKDYEYSDDLLDVSLDTRRTEVVIGFGLRF